MVISSRWCLTREIQYDMKLHIYPSCINAERAVMVIVVFLCQLGSDTCFTVLASVDTFPCEIQIRLCSISLEVDDKDINELRTNL